MGEDSRDEDDLEDRKSYCFHRLSVVERKTHYVAESREVGDDRDEEDLRLGRRDLRRRGKVEG